MCEAKVSWLVERSGSWVTLRTLNKENPGSNPVLQCDILDKCFNAPVHSAVNEYLAIDSGGYLYEQRSRINCSVAGCFPEKLRV